jgi:quinol-cytochrome oxidoreductase complex cytochrome b subunit
MKTATSLLVFLVVVCLLIAQHTAGKLSTTRYSSQYWMLDSNTSQEFEVFWIVKLLFLFFFFFFLFFFFLSLLHYKDWAKQPFQS